MLAKRRDHFLQEETDVIDPSIKERLKTRFVRIALLLFPLGLYPLGSSRAQMGGPPTWKTRSPMIAVEIELPPPG